MLNGGYFAQNLSVGKKTRSYHLSTGPKVWHRTIGLNNNVELFRSKVGILAIYET